MTYPLDCHEDLHVKTSPSFIGSTEAKPDWEATEPCKADWAPAAVGLPHSQLFAQLALACRIPAPGAGLTGQLLSRQSTIKKKQAHVMIRKISGTAKTFLA